jgi:polyhydroxybutyrate depolymerase
VKKQHLLVSLALAVSSLLATTTADGATREPARATAGKQASTAKQPRAKPAQRPKSAKKPVRKPLKKPGPKAAPPTAAGPSTDIQSAITKPGDFRFAIQHDGRERTYRVHVPPGYAAAEPVPLLVALHGAATDAQGNDGLQSLLRESDRQGFVAVFPDAYGTPGKGQAASWNAGHCCGDARQQQVDDVGFIQAVVTNVFRQLSIQRYRIYAAGLSDGGMMAYRLACDLPNIFKAVASVGGTDNTAACSPGKPVSVLHIHARNDPRVPFSGTAGGAGPGTAPHFTSARETAAKWAELNGCMATPRLILEQAGASCEAYSYCRAQAEVQLCATDTGGHSWPGTARRGGAESPSQAISASRVMWAFFNSR